MPAPALTRRSLYRVRQFARAVGARPSAADLALVRSRLTRQQQALFLTLSPRDQWHSVQTLRLLPAMLQADADVATAALLHDAGKGWIRLHERVLFVLLSARPSLLHAVVRPGAGWRAALYRSLHHAETGAHLALAAGVSPRAAALIRAHHQPDPADPVARALFDADERA